MLLDSSPILLIPDNLYMAAAADGIMLVVRGRARPARAICCARRAILERVGHADPRGRPQPDARSKQLNQYYKHYSAYYKRR